MTNANARAIRANARAIAAHTLRAEIAAYKVAHDCDSCGSAWRNVATDSLALVGVNADALTLSLFLDLDHINPETKRGNVSDMIGRYADATVWAEVAKCRVLCANCHRAHTFTIQRANR